MKKITLDYYIALDKQFKKQCARVADELSRLDRNEYGYCDYFYLSDDGTYVVGEGDEYWAYGGYEHHNRIIPVKLLTYSDKQLKQYVDNKIEEWEAEQQKEKEAENQRKMECELAELARLKEKYEPQN